MKVNVGNLDCPLRLLAPVLMMASVFTHPIRGTWSYVLIGLSTVFSLTSLLHICPLLAPFEVLSNECGDRSGQLAYYLQNHGIACINGGSWFDVNHEINKLS